VEQYVMADDDLPARDVQALFAAAETQGRVGIARKTKPVDARPAKLGEIVVTTILGEGKETHSKPAQPGDMVVRNRCPATGNEQYLVNAATFAERYAGSGSDPDAEGWCECRPLGPEMCFFFVGQEEGEFRFTAPWGELMRARVGDAVVRNPVKPDDTYRVARLAFECTYEILTHPGKT
jgi:hypothetical protein